MKRFLVVGVLALTLSLLLVACGKGGDGVTTPAPTTPAVTTPSVTTPSVTTPEVTTPEVTTPPVTQPDTVTVHFSVDGVLQSVTVLRGELPVCPSTPYRPATATEGWRFTGWDKPIEAAVSEVTYVAQFEKVTSYTIRWVLGDGITKTSYVAKGEIPVYDGVPTRKNTAQHSYTFTGWNTEPVAATKNAIYSAEYERTVNSYTISFVHDGIVLQTEVLEYGTTPAFKGKEPTMSEMTFAGWDPVPVSVSADVTYNAVFGKPDENGVYFNMTPSVLNLALSTGLVDYNVGNGQKTNPFNAMTATGYLLLQQHYNPAVQIRDRILEQLRALILPGNEPDMDSGAQWSFADCAIAIALAKHTPTVWEELTEEEIARLDLIMRCFVVTGSFGMNDCNDYKTTLAMVGNYSKTWNPNYRFTTMGAMLAASQYFGSAAAIDSVLLSFSYDAYMSELNAFGFTNIVTTWSKAGKTLMEEGGSAISATGANYGTGLGCKQPFLYQGFTLDQETEILHSLLTHCYSGGKVVSEIYQNGEKVAYILTGAISPMQGKTGMMLELYGGDAGGVRSSASYSMADLNISQMLIASMMLTGTYDPAEALTREMKNMIYVGNTDLIFKIREGYRCFANGGNYDFGYDSYAGKPLIFDLWETQLSKIIDYVEPDGYIIRYTVNGSTFTENFESADVLIGSYGLPEGHVWYDGKYYYKAGAAYTFTEKGVFELEAIKGYGAEAGSSKLASASGTLTLAQNAANDAQYSISKISAGKILLEITLSGDAASLPKNFNIQYKHTTAANPSTALLNCTNGVLYAGSMTDVEICEMDPAGVTLAVLYDTVEGTVVIWLLRDGEFHLVHSFVHANEEGTAGRLAYLYISRKTNDVTSASYSIQYTIDAYLGFNAPFTAPVSEQSVGYTAAYTVNGVTTELEEEDANLILSSDLLPAGHIWYDGTAFYNGGASYVILAGKSASFTAVPGAALDGATKYQFFSGSQVLSPGATADVNVQYQPSQLYTGIMMTDITLSAAEGKLLPTNYNVQYKHQKAPNPATTLFYLSDGILLAGDGSEICAFDLTEPIRIAAMYDTVSGDVKIWLYEDGAFTLKATYNTPNETGTAGRTFYLYLPYKTNDTSSGEVGLNYSATLYSGVTEPVILP